MVDTADILVLDNVVEAVVVDTTDDEADVVSVGAEADVEATE